jgi:hypothetical protein
MSFTLNLCREYAPLHIPHTTYMTTYTTYPKSYQWHHIPPHPILHRTVLSILFLFYTAIHINNIPIPVVHAHTFQLASPPNTPNLSSMSYPADYDGDDPPPPFIYATRDSDDEDDSDDEVGCGGVGYDGDWVDKKMTIPAKRDAPINIMRNMASKFFNWGCTITFNTPPRAEEKTFVNLLDYVNPNPKIISKEYQAECIQNEFPLNLLFQFPWLHNGEKMWKILLSELVYEAAIQGGFRLVFLARVKTETTRFSSTPFDVWGARFMGKTRKICPMPTISRGKTLVQIGSMRMVFKKRQLRGGL